MVALARAWAEKLGSWPVTPIFNNIKHQKKLYNTRDKFFIYSQNYVASIIGCASGSDRDIHGIILTHKRCSEDPISLFT